MSGPDHFKLTLDGASRDIPLAPGQTLLAAALAAGVDAPHGCEQGNCGACMAQLREGKVAMARDAALSKRNIERGYVLACQAVPDGDGAIWLDFDF